jgi:glycosyltransferase involved in cell wall biosynthesis
MIEEYFASEAVNRSSDSVSAIITVFNLGWCIKRAMESCLAQSMPLDEMIVVDDCSTDNTEAIVRDFMAGNPHIRYFQTERNGGLLAALRLGIQHAFGDWIALLDGDDQLTLNSIESRINAATEYKKATGVTPQLVYGDHQESKFTRLKGYVFPYLCKELCLCQTSTIMLGRKCLKYFPRYDRPYNTDDQIVLAIGKHFPVLHCGSAVAIYHVHKSPNRMSNNSEKVLAGIRLLVQDYEADIVDQQGQGRLFLWRLRILRALINYKISLVNLKIAGMCTGTIKQSMLRAQRFILNSIRKNLTHITSMYFERDYF